MFDIDRDLHVKIPPLPPKFSFYVSFIRPLLFMMDPEKAHDKIIRFLSWLWSKPKGRELTHRIFIRKHVYNPIEVAGLKFKNQIGLAAGFDKNANLIEGIENIGFGFVEVGTVTPKPQRGNDKPRIFREKARRTLVNRMGFPNDGMNVIFDRVHKHKSKMSIPVGINISKNKDTPNAIAVNDYEVLLKRFATVADFFTINISSPNTPGLKALQSLDFLNPLGIVVNKLGISQPVFIKLSPDIPNEDLQSVCSLIGPNKTFSGLILCNTLPTDLGGISGYPMKKTALQMLLKVRGIVSRDTPIISVGGIETAQDLRERIEAGANAVQIYTSLIFQGPGIVKDLVPRVPHH